MSEKTGHLAHHFETPKQQFDSSKLGMWLFLATEILLFGGLFCAYAVYRANHPEIFIYAHQYLDKTLGGLNTVVLICSSLTMAWAVRAAQLGQQKLLQFLLVATIVLAGVFLGVKYVEYKQKWEHGLLWGKRYHPTLHEAAGHGTAPESLHGEAAGSEHAGTGPAPAAGDGEAHTADAESTAPREAAPPGGEAAAGAEAGARAPAPGEDRTLQPPPGEAPRGLAAPGEADPHSGESPRNVQVFFSIYFAMTGLHGIHVLAGIICIAWLFFRARAGAFGPDYFTPVDLVGLYWHLVDMIWIYLFPLLYLIH